MNLNASAVFSFSRLGFVSLSLAVFSVSAQAANCEFSIKANDMMKYNVNEIVIDKTCTQFTVHLKNVGKMPKNAMGHNWVLAKTADINAIATEGMKAGQANDYIPGDTKIIAHTKLLGPGEEGSVTFETAKLMAGTPYSFFCTFPAHHITMNGTVKLQ